MNIKDVMKMTPEEFANSWNDNNDIVDACYEAIGARFVPIDEN